MKRLGPFLAAALLMAACGGGSDPPGPVAGSVRLVEIGAFVEPTALVEHQGALYVAEKAGRVRVLRNGKVATLLDIRREVTTDRVQGLLGLAIAPSGAMYLYFTGRDNDPHVIEVDATHPEGGRRELLNIHLPNKDHIGGALAIGPDDLLYIAVGDGGSPSEPQKAGQDLGELRGKILRIDPRPSKGKPYTVPEDNPFVGRKGARSEIWHYGLRNPWRFSFDRSTAEMWIADAGQHKLEEVNRVGRGVRGVNFGWPRYEGSRRFMGKALREHTLPFYEYRNPPGQCAVVIGGYVYRGEQVRPLQGRYVFADFCEGELLALGREPKAKAEQIGVHVDGISSFGQDARGELYVLSLGGKTYRMVPTD